MKQETALPWSFGQLGYQVHFCEMNTVLFIR